MAPLRFAIWAVFLSAVAIALYVQLRQPTNYTSLRISRESIEYVEPSNRYAIPFKDITAVAFVREHAWRVTRER